MNLRDTMLKMLRSPVTTICKKPLISQASFLRAMHPQKKNKCLNTVRRYAEQLKRRCAVLLENWQSSRREDLGLAFANLELFDGYDFGLSDEFVRLRSNTGLYALIKKPFTKWTERDQQEFDRLLSALKKAFDREK